MRTGQYHILVVLSRTVSRQYEEKKPTPCSRFLNSGRGQITPTAHAVRKYLYLHVNRCSLVRHKTNTLKKLNKTRNTYLK